MREGIDDAAAIEISLIENVAREDADTLTCYETYVTLIRQGRSVGEVARLFGKKEREITQCLALANLLPRIRDLFRNDELDGSDLQLLTMATKTQQREWLRLWDDNDVPTGSDLKHWLFGGTAIRAEYALFDLEPFKERMVGDLFSQERYFASAKEFWSAQDLAIAARRDTYLAAKWSEVIILERGKHFPQWEFVKASKKEGGRVYIEPTLTGEVRFHEGYLTQREVRSAEKKNRKAKVGDKAEAEGEQRSPNYKDDAKLSRPAPPCGRPPCRIGATQRRLATLDRACRCCERKLVGPARSAARGRHGDCRKPCRQPGASDVRGRSQDGSCASGIRDQIRGSRG